MLSGVWSFPLDILDGVVRLERYSMAIRRWRWSESIRVDIHVNWHAYSTCPINLRKRDSERDTSSLWSVQLMLFLAHRKYFFSRRFRRWKEKYSRQCNRSQLFNKLGDVVVSCKDKCARELSLRLSLSLSPLLSLYTQTYTKRMIDVWQRKALNSRFMILFSSFSRSFHRARWKRCENDTILCALKTDETGQPTHTWWVRQSINRSKSQLVEAHQQWLCRSNSTRTREKTETRRKSLISEPIDHSISSLSFVRSSSTSTTKTFVNQRKTQVQQQHWSIFTSLFPSSSSASLLLSLLPREATTLVKKKIDICRSQPITIYIDVLRSRSLILSP
jgi:hypothetical protein